MEGMGLCREMFHSNLEWYAMLVFPRGGQYGGLTQQNQNICQCFAITTKLYHPIAPTY